MTTVHIVGELFSNSFLERSIESSDEEAHTKSKVFKQSISVQSNQ